MTTYRRKYVPTIEAIQLEERQGARTELIKWVEARTTAQLFDYNDETWPQFGITVDPADSAIIIALPGGSSARAVPGDYVCRSARGQLFVRSASAIRDTYEPVEPAPDPTHERLEAVTSGTRSMVSQLAEEAQRLMGRTDKQPHSPFRQRYTSAEQKQAAENWTARNAEIMAENRCPCGAPGTITRTDTYPVPGGVQPIFRYCDAHASVPLTTMWFDGVPLVDVAPQRRQS